MKTNYIKLSVAILFVLQVNNVFAQTEQSASKGKLNITADLVSRFVWRGLDPGGASAHFQPTFSYSNSGFEVGAWGTYGLSNSYAEVDLYAKYSTNGFTLQYTNYYNPVSAVGAATSANTKFYNFGKSTASVGEISLSYKGKETFPISILAGTFLYGNDHDYGYKASLDAKHDNYYSTYFELGYSAKVADQGVDLFLGATPGAGFYGNKAGVVNAGVKATRSIKITDNYSLPITASLITNPQAERIYAVIGITL